MLDYDLAVLYEVPTKALNQAMRRNIDRFPEDFMFQLSREEYNSLRSHIVTIEGSGKGAYSKYNPYAFTEHGVTMLASVLKSDKAVKMNIEIVRHREQLVKIYAAIEILLAEKENQQSWADRERIGYK